MVWTICTLSPYKKQRFTNSRGTYIYAMQVLLSIFRNQIAWVDHIVADMYYALLNLWHWILDLFCKETLARWLRYAFLCTNPSFLTLKTQSIVWLDLWLLHISYDSKDALKFIQGPWVKIFWLLNCDLSFFHDLIECYILFFVSLTNLSVLDKISRILSSLHCSISSRCMLVLRWA